METRDNLDEQSKVMLSLQKSKMEILAFRCCNENYRNIIPAAIDEVIRLFYDEYFH